MSSTLNLHSPLTLLTDLYQVSMCYGYWKAGIHNREAVFHLFFRKKPFQGGFVVAAGLETVIEFLQSFRFEDSDLAYLASLKSESNQPLFEKDFLTYLKELQFSCDVEAVPEGTIVFPYEPLLRVRGPLIQAQFLETILLNLINFPTLIATKAARVCIAAKEDLVIEFGLRRAQGIDGALTASRSAFIGGCHATSNVLAGKLFDIPVKGTLSHSWIMVFEDELEAFYTYAKHLPSNCVFLVDTYDTIQGVKNAIKVGQWLKEHGYQLAGIRLDSGDLAELSIKSRKLLDQAGFRETKIVASNELDETIISELKRQGAQINVWGVGTHLTTAKGQSALDGVYKLSAIRDLDGNWQYKLKLSEQMLKVSNPGILQVKRFFSANEYIADVIYDEQIGFSEDSLMIDPLDPTKQKHLKGGLQSLDLLIPIFRKGKKVYDCPSIHEIRAKTLQELKRFSVGIKRFLNPHQYVVGMEQQLHHLKFNLIQQIRRQTSHASILPQDLDHEGSHFS